MSRFSSSNKPLQLQITTLDYSDFLGRIVIGKIHNGTIKNGQQASLIKENGKTIKGKVSNCLLYTSDAADE